MAPVVAALNRRRTLRQLIVHTGQHYDARMSDEILADLDFPEPDHFLGVGSGPHGEQTAKVLAAFERILLDVHPDAVVVAGDVNSTLACALAASKLGIPVAHLESGLRSGDWSMPEEINRVLTDRLSDILLTHSPECVDNLVVGGHRPRARALRRQHDDRLAAALREEGTRPGGASATTACASTSTCWRRSTGRRTSTIRIRLARISDRADRARRAFARRLPDPSAHPRAARVEPPARPPRGRRRPLHRAGRLSRVPVAPGRRGRDPDRLGRRSRKRRRRSASLATRSGPTPSARSP